MGIGNQIDRANCLPFVNFLRSSECGLGAKPRLAPHRQEEDLREAGKIAPQSGGGSQPLVRFTRTHSDRARRNANHFAISVTVMPPIGKELSSAVSRAD